MFEDAIKYFNQALKLKSDYFEALYGLSYVYYKIQNYDNALLHLNKSIQLKPGYLPPVKSKLHLLKVMKKKQDILKFLNDMIVQFPDDAFFYSEKALVLSDLGKETEAINSYKNAYLIEPEYPFVLGQIVLDKLLNGEWNKIENDCEEILSKTKNERRI